MTTDAPRFPFALDPLIAEAKHRMLRRRLLGLVGLVAVGLIAASVFAFHGGGGPGATSANEFQAFQNGTIARGIQIEWVGRGRCGGAAWNDNRQNTWICGPNKTIPAKLDRFGLGYVCFSSGSQARFVICPISPWSHKAVEIRLPRPLGNWQRSYAGVWTKQQRKWAALPWGVTTTNGKRCVNLVGHGSGGPPVPGAGYLNYTCTDGSSLFGFPDRRASVWTISYGTISYGARAEPIKRVGISAVWQ